MPHILVIVRVPEVELYVGELRARFDPAARRGLGAHVTLLHEPLLPDGIDAAMMAAIAEAAAGVAPFHYTVTGLARFPGTLYLAVEPAEPFNELHARLAPPPARTGQGRWLGAGCEPPREFVPHISVVRKARRGDRALADAAVDAAVDARAAAQAELTPLLAEHAPLHCECREIVLLEDSTGTWRPVRAFALSGCTDDPLPAPS